LKSEKSRIKQRENGLFLQKNGRKRTLSAQKLPPLNLAKAGVTTGLIPGGRRSRSAGGNEHRETTVQSQKIKQKRD